jgi:hypothetical protein
VRCPPHGPWMRPASLSLGLHARRIHSRAPPISALGARPSRTHASIPTATMTAIYKPTEAIALLRPSFLLPRIQPPSRRRAQTGRPAFSTTPNVQATHSSTNTPSPHPPRKSITLTGDTGQVRWSDLSPGEKAVRTTQQSANLIVVLVGVIATVSPIPLPRSYQTATDKHPRRA